MNILRLIFTTLALITATLLHAQSTSNDTVAAAPYSGTLPVMYINTDSMKPIDSKEVYLKATYYLDPMGIKGVKAVASAETPDTMQIKGRGNATWKMVKKPYRIKLNKKTGLMGMPKSKHFVMLAHYDDFSHAYLMDESGFELSRRFKMAFTPSQKPVEVVLNGEYIGVYFIAQNIRIDADRVNITAQSSKDSIPDVTGGWLLEKDNTIEDNQLLSPLGRFSFQDPEEPNADQMAYINKFFNKIYKSLFDADKRNCTWEKYIDLDTLARFYIINEILDDVEAFVGSCYMHKQRGDSTKLIFGPVWDFGRALGRSANSEFNMLYENVPSYLNNTMLLEMLKFPRFQHMIRKVWTEEIDNVRDGLNETLLQWAYALSNAGTYDHSRWPGARTNQVEKEATEYIRNLNARIDWLDNIWNLNNIYDVNGDGLKDIADINHMIATILAQQKAGRKTTDFNFDGATDIADINMLVGNLLSIETIE